MIVIRQGVFETNSSSVHSIAIVTQENYDSWGSENPYFDGKSFYSFSELKDLLMEDEYFREEVELLQLNGVELKEEELSKLFKNYGYYTLENFGEDYERFEEYFTTPNGDEMVAFGYYGRD